MRRTFLKSLLALAAMLPLSIPLGFADTHSPILERITKSGTLHVGMSAGQPPYNMKTREGDIIGLDVDLARLLAKAMGIELEIETMPFGELLPALEKGKVDLVISGMTATLQRNMRAAFIGPYHVSGKSILARGETIEALTSEGLDRESLKIAALKGSTSEKFVQQNAPKAKLSATESYDKAIDLLLSNKVDLFVADAPIIMLSKMRWPTAGLVSSAEPLTIEPIGVAVPPNDPLFINLVDNYMQMLRVSGALEKLEKKWFENPSWLARLP
jgi:polar amino acid transport system substrate-binding protein